MPLVDANRSGCVIVRFIHCSSLYAGEQEYLFDSGNQRRGPDDDHFPAKRHLQTRHHGHQSVREASLRHPRISSRSGEESPVEPQSASCAVL